PLRTGGSVVSLLSAATGDETPSPATANGEAGEAPALLPRANAPADGKPDYVFITLKCILQLLLIQTVGELFGVDVELGESHADAAVEGLYGHMSAHHLFILLDCLDQSRAFAHRFNANHKVRRRLVEMGVMPTMPSLLKQETGSVLIELHILHHMHADAIGASFARGELAKSVASERETVVEEVDERLSQLMRAVTRQYLGRETDDEGDGSAAVGKRRVVSMANRPDPATTETKKQMMLKAAWRPSVLAVLEYVLRTARASSEKRMPFKTVVSRLWPDLVEIIGVAMDAGDRDIVGAVQQILN
ncbi:guanine nucleotide exchange protein for ADP-robosylation factor, partial [Coemansia erecta]